MGAGQFISGNFNAQADHGSSASVYINAFGDMAPRPVDPELLGEAERLLEDLPLELVPDPEPPFPGSVVPPIDPNPLLVGRQEDLKALATRIKADGDLTGPVRTVAITGLGGVGKTQVAAEFAHRYGRYFRGGIYWLNLSDPSSLDAEIAACGGAGAMRLRPDFEHLSLENQVKEVVAAWRSELPRLLVLDNCDDVPSLKKCRPTTGGCRVLITSRGPLGNPTLNVIQWPMEVLSREDSVKLLRNHCRDMAVNEADLEAVAEELGDLPLALDLAGRFLWVFRFAVTPEEYVEQLRGEDLLAHASMSQHGEFSPTGHEMDVRRTLMVSYERLNGSDPVDRLAVKLLARVARFAPGEAVPRGLLLSTLNPPEDASGDPAEEGPSPLQRERALGRLRALGLITEEARTGSVRMHRLVAAFALDEVDDEEAQSDVEREVASEAERALFEGQPVRLTSLLPHLRHMAKSVGDREDETANLVHHALGFSLYKLKEYDEARPHLERAVEISVKLRGPAHWATFRQRSNLAMVMEHQGESDAALKMYEGVLEDQKRELGPRHHDVASTLNNIGVLQRQKGLYEEVRSAYEQALEIRKDVLGLEHRDTAESLDNIGALLMDLDRHDEARPYLQQAMEVNERVLGRNHLDKIGPLLNLGSLLRKEGNYAEACTLYERALEIREHALGQEHPDTLASLGGLGMMLAEQGAYDEALPCLERALERSQSLHGEDHPATAMCLNTLARVLETQGNYGGARSLYERELAISEKLLGEDHPQTARCLSNVARVLTQQGFYTEAISRQDRAVGINAGTFGVEHPATVGALQDMANVRFAQGAYEEARQLYECVLTVRWNVLGENHADTAMSMHNLGNLLRHSGAFAEAQPYLEQALATFQRVLGEEHPNTAKCLHQLAISLQMQGRFEEARPYLVRGLAASEKAFGKEHPITKMVRENLSILDAQYAASGPSDFPSL